VISSLFAGRHLCDVIQSADAPETSKRIGSRLEAFLERLNVARRLSVVDVLLELPIEPFRADQCIDEDITKARRDNRSAGRLMTGKGTKQNIFCEPVERSSAAVCSSTGGI